MMYNAGLGCWITGIILFVLAIPGYFLGQKSSNPDIRLRLTRWPLTLGFIFFLIGISLLVRELGAAPVFYGLTMFILWVAFAAAMLHAWQRVRKYDAALAQNQAPNIAKAYKGEKSFFNLEKGFSGAMFGDIAVTTALMSGAAAYKLSNLEPNWFWLGLMGVWLGILVSFSQALRSILANWGYSKVDSQTDVWVLCYSALGNLNISLLTLLALMSPVKGNEAFSKNWTLIGGQIGVLSAGFILPLILMIIWFGWYYRRHATGKLGFWIFYWSLMLLSLVGTIITLSLFGSSISEAPGYLTNIFAILAIAIWVAMETTGVQLSRKDPKKVLRGVLIIIGNAFMTALLIWLAVAGNTSYVGGNWILFCAGLTLPTLATLIGIDLGIENLAEKKRRKAPRGSVSMDPMDAL